MCSNKNISVESGEEHAHTRDGGGMGGGGSDCNLASRPPRLSETRGHEKAEQNGFNQNVDVFLGLIVLLTDEKKNLYCLLAIKLNCSAIRVRAGRMRESLQGHRVRALTLNSSELSWMDDGWILKPIFIF